MNFVEPVEDLIRALESARLPRLAGDLRAYLDDGVLANPPTVEQLFSEGEVEQAYRERSPREQVIAACAFVAEQLIEPYFMIEEGQLLAALISDTDDAQPIDKVTRPIMIADPDFMERVPAAAITPEELDAARVLAKLLPRARRAMLTRLDEGDVALDDPAYDPFRSDRGGSIDQFTVPGSPIDKEMRFPQRGGRSRTDPDFIRDEWPTIDNNDVLRELGETGNDLNGY